MIVDDEDTRKTSMTNVIKTRPPTAKPKHVMTNVLTNYYIT